MATKAFDVGCLVASLVALAAANLTSQSAGARGGSTVALDNAVVRVITVRDAASAPVEHGAGVVVALDDTTGMKAGDALWADDVAAPGMKAGRTVLVIPKKTGAAAAAPPSASKPGDAPFTGMSFKTLFENDTVAVIRARMDRGAREGFHTHASDTIVVHLSGGSIEDTADGKTQVNHWKHGDVEFEARGSSHSARNVGDAVDVVLVTLKP